MRYRYAKRKCNEIVLDEGFRRKKYDWSRLAIESGKFEASFLRENDNRFLRKRMIFAADSRGQRNRSEHFFRMKNDHGIGQTERM